MEPKAASRPLTDESTKDQRKARGAYFTPAPIAEFMAKWAIENPNARVLEPSCGEAAFLVPAVARLRALSGSGEPMPTVDGVEIHRPSAKVAERLIASAGGLPRVRVADFFEVASDPIYDAVIGNPPFIRYQSFKGSSLQSARNATQAAGITLSGLASSWAAFAVHAATFLRVGGRLAFVLPAELLSVDYAARVRQFLMDRFGSIRIVTFSSPVFSGVQTDVVLLLASDFGGRSESVRLEVVASSDDLATTLEGRTWVPSSRTGKWSAGRLDEDAEGIFRRVAGSAGVDTLSSWGNVSLGVVTGSNSFFGLSSARVAELELEPNDIVSLAPPVRPAKRGLSFSAADNRDAIARGSDTWLFSPGESPSAAALRYIAAGESASVNEGYKCRGRSPWWSVPIGTPGDLMLTYMSSEMPRVIGNPHRHRHLNSLHKMDLSPGRKAIGRLLPMAALSSLTTLGAELAGRTYGGGVLKLELNEFRVLPVPNLDVLKAAHDDLAAVRDKIDVMLRTGRGGAASRQVDEILLTRHMGVSASDVKALQTSQAFMRLGRHLRAGGS